MKRQTVREIPVYMTSAQVAETLGVSRQNIRFMVNTGKLMHAAETMSGALLFDPDTVKVLAATYRNRLGDKGLPR